MEQKFNMLPVGTLLRGGTYRVTRQLKSGGFGNTYVVENVHFGETYAMKEFFMKGVTSRNGTTVCISIEDNAKAFYEQKEKFKKEAKRIRKLNHPNIVKIHDLFEDNGTCYYVMDFIDGESLADWIKTHGAMPETEALRMLNSALDALGAVHAAGFAHMDVTPRNIMRNKNGDVFLIDFGASKQIASSELRTLSGTAMPYSPGYAPTEQMNKDADRVGPWTDLYALGATMFRLLTTQSPPSSSEVVSFATNGADPFHFTHDITESTQSLIKWMMHPAIEIRPQSVEEIRERLRKIKGSTTSYNQDENATVYDDNRVKDVEILSVIAGSENKEDDSRLNESEEKFQDGEYDKSSVGFFHDGLAKVKGLNGKYGFIDQSGKLLIPCRWESVETFSSGMAAVKDVNKKWGYINTTGKIVIPCKWSGVQLFQGETAKVKDNSNKWVEIDKTGHVIETVIHVVSTPEGASVAIDGKWIGATPDKFGVEPGRHEVKVANGSEWSVHTQAVELVKGQTIHVFTTLEQKKTFIDVRSNPKGATVYIDDKWCGTTPIKYEVAPGKHEIKLANGEAWSSYHRVIYVENAKTVKINAVLTKKKIKSISSNETTLAKKSDGALRLSQNEKSDFERDRPPYSKKTRLPYWLKVSLKVLIESMKFLFCVSELLLLIYATFFWNFRIINGFITYIAIMGIVALTAHLLYSKWPYNLLKNTSKDDGTEK